MKCSVILVFSFFFLGFASVVGQEIRSGCTVPTAETLKRSGKLEEKDESKYRSQIRYLVVYDDIFPNAGRVLEVLVDVRSIREIELKTVFCWLSEKYPSPKDLTINVHTSLETIETPDERELLRDGDDSRFVEYLNKYPRANYQRFSGGREVMSFTANHPRYRERTIVIRQ